jgi:hypothetical protein
MTTMAPTPPTQAPTPDAVTTCRCSGQADKLGRGERCAVQRATATVPKDPAAWCYCSRACPRARPSRYFVAGLKSKQRLFWRHCKPLRADREGHTPKHYTYWQRQAHGTLGSEN